MNGKRRLIGSFWHGSMANAMSQAIGAQAAFARRQVISLSGDGGFTMLMGDFLTLVQHDLPVKVVVFNNGALGFIEIEQKSSGFLDFGTKFKNPNFAAMAEAVGVRGIRLEDPGEVERGIAEALAHDGPVLVDAVVKPDGTSHSPQHHRRDGQGLHALHAQSRDGRPRRRSDRSRQGEPLGVIEGEGQPDGRPLLAIGHPMYIALPINRNRNDTETQETEKCCGRSSSTRDPTTHRMCSKARSMKPIAPTWLPSISRKRRRIPPTIGTPTPSRNS